jgi:acetoacetate decarboxylase
VFVVDLGMTVLTDECGRFVHLTERALLLTATYNGHRGSVVATAYHADSTHIAVTKHNVNSYTSYKKIIEFPKVLLPPFHRETFTPPWKKREL